MTRMHSSTDTFAKLTVCLVLALLFGFAAADAQAASPASADVFAQVKEGMSSNEVRALLGAPIYERKRKGATYSFAWVYCCIPHGAPQSEPDRHPHFWIEFSKDEETVQKRMKFSDVERGDFPGHDRDMIEYVFPEEFFAAALAELAPVTVALNPTALKKELAIWLRDKLPDTMDTERMAEEVFEKQVKANLERQIEVLNSEVDRLLQQCGADMLRRANRSKTGLSVQAGWYYFPCEPHHGRWVVWNDPSVEHIAKLNASDKVYLKPFPVTVAEFGRNRREEFKPVCEVEVNLQLEFSGSTVGGFNPPQDSRSAFTVQPKAILTASRTVMAGSGMECGSMQIHSLQKTFAPQSLSYLATFEAQRRDRE